MEDLRTEAGVLDQGSQMVVVRGDLAKEVSARINTQRTPCIKGASGSTFHTLDAQGGFNMVIGDLFFTINAHVVRRALRAPPRSPILRPPGMPA